MTPTDPGLSVHSSLHELPAHVILVVATPGEIRSRGMGLTIRAGAAACPFGCCLIGETARGICHLAFFDAGSRTSAMAEMHASWPQAEVLWDDTHAARLAAAIFAPSMLERPSASWNVFVRGTPFQLRVWRALLRVPAGSRISYCHLAAAAGHPTAARATGSAVGKNPVAFLIPCHRVIRENGTPGLYRWGALRKRAMLAWESAGIHAGPHC
ncbi:MAG: methylated-DNA--[protein]-cysteine S-methyltransferase [Verrucomicrobia bacterium]|nr:methylated-DNA--[protein]-cysteine S-methyltransferase [Verrucomicrobiota bacterium]